MKLGKLIRKVDSPLITEAKVLNLERRHGILGSRTVKEGSREYKDYPDEAIEILKKLAVSKKLGFKEKEVIQRIKSGEEIPYKMPEIDIPIFKDDLAVVIMAIPIMIRIQQFLISRIGYREAYPYIYQAARDGIIDYFRNVFRIYPVKEEEHEKKLEAMLYTYKSAGWGDPLKPDIDFAKKEGFIRVKNVSFVRHYNQDVSYEVCIIPSGFIAGGASLLFGDDGVECYEKKCGVVNGENYCEFVITKKDTVKKELEKRWDRLGLKKTNTIERMHLELE